MAAYVVVHATPKDADKMAEYGAAAGPMVAAHGGELVARGPGEALHGDSGHAMVVVVKFPSKAAALGWYNSPEYQAIIPTRSAGMDCHFTVVGE